MPSLSPPSLFLPPALICLSSNARSLPCAAVRSALQFQLSIVCKKSREQKVMAKKLILSLILVEDLRALSYTCDAIPLSNYSDVQYFEVIGIGTPLRISLSSSTPAAQTCWSHLPSATSLSKEACLFSPFALSCQEYEGIMCCY